MEMTASEFATHRGISVQRARELARDGKVEARREGRQWVITQGEMRLRTRRGLGSQTRDDLLVYLRTRNLDHVSGMRKRRLANVVAQVEKSQNPSALIREYFSGTQEPQGVSGEAVVRAAMRGMDDQVNSVLRMQHRLVIRDVHVLAKRITERRMISNMTTAQLAKLVGVPEAVVKQVERGSYQSINQMLARKMTHVLKLPISKMVISVNQQ